MKTLYLECAMGAAGDMLTAALVELTDREKFLNIMRSLGLPDTDISADTVTKSGITGTQMTIRIKGIEEDSKDIHSHDHSHEGATHEHAHDNHAHGHDHHEDGHHHASLGDIESLIRGLEIPDKVKDDAIAVYKMLAEAESHVHGQSVEEIHFHEVGAMDAVADIVGVCLLMDMISPERVIVSPVNVGSGHVRCAHGILPVPAPATAYLLRDVPMYSGRIEGELCTPTGAALLKYFADDFGKMPEVRTEKIGYGFGKKEFEMLNCVRAFLAEEKCAAEQVLELKCNLDDMTPEHIGFAMDMLFEAGALDVFTTPVMMKKNRPAVLLTVLCRPGKRSDMIREIFKHTTTIGIRETICDRYVLERDEEIRHTQEGDIRIKNVRGYGVSRSKPEFEDISGIAREKNMSISDVQKNL